VVFIIKFFIRKIGIILRKRAWKQVFMRVLREVIEVYDACVEVDVGDVSGIEKDGVWGKERRMQWRLHKKGFKKIRQWKDFSEF